MKPINTTLALGLTFAITACAGNGTSHYVSSPVSTPATARDTPQGALLTSPEGRALYTFAKDKDGQSSCYGPCAEKWPPFIASADEQPQADFTLTTRKDSSRQWRYNGQPLYTWIKDRQAGDVTGHGVKNIWFAARADDVPVKVYLNAGGQVLTDLAQMSLYTFDKDGPNHSNCYQKCATLWPPLVASEDAKASGPFSIVKRDDGSAQWALNGKPLYTWIKDGNPGDISGDGVKDVWRLATLP